ncbi:MBL fold metallo-hydrolase [Archangium lipolyticum]|uniref:MBL fold metallo-hydrolase n=1 Tax=Archangium lipolyticum TaxID=2970465 RepID=UPI002149D0FE|nr:MBL fold metallo-hydrolase [Archangium lipolyticum]
MFFQAIQTPGLAHVSYVLGSDGAALVVDPRRDLDVYLDVLQSQGLRLRYVLMTHRQEDFVLGTTALARLTGARIVAGKHPITGYADLQMGERERLQLGSLSLLALHTPGHTPESFSWAVFLDSHPQHAWGIFTGDALLAGETGRTDLHDPERTYENAAWLYDSLHREVLPLGDQTLVFPAHGAGSMCGGHIDDRALTTLGIERQRNPVFVLGREDFIAHKLRERLPRPPYFSRMAELNLQGGFPLDREPRTAPPLSPREFQQASRDGLVIDTREPEAFAGGHLPGSLNIWMKGLPVFAGWVADRDTPVFLVLPEGADLAQAVLSLARVGIDRVEGVLAGGFGAWRTTGLPIERNSTLIPNELHEHSARFQLLDVRDISEFESGHIPGARHAYVGELEERLPGLGLSPDDPVAVVCGSGLRSGLATSLLLRHGFQSVSNLLGGMTAWKKLDLPVEEGTPRLGEAPPPGQPMAGEELYYE